MLKDLDVTLSVKTVDGKKELFVKTVKTSKELLDSIATFRSLLLQAESAILAEMEKGR